jgi:hypothetical protein
MVAALAVACCAACSGSHHKDRVYGAPTARLGESLAVLGWNTSMSNLRWQDNYVLVDVDAAPTDPAKAHADPRDVRFGLYGALAHPMEATGIGSCENERNLKSSVIQALSAPKGKRLTGTVCLGPLSDRSAVRGVYLYSPRDRIADTAAAYPAAFPVGVPPTKQNDTGLVVKTPGLSPACSAYGSSVLILPEASLDAVHVSASLCTQGDINEALLYATIAVVGTHAAVWTTQ